MATPESAASLHRASPLIESLTGKFVIVSLGAAGDRDLELPPLVTSAVTLVEVDGAGASATAKSYNARHPIASYVAGTRRDATFSLRAYPACSSLLEPRPELVEHYGLEEYFRLVEARPVHTETLPRILETFGIDSVDYLKTDLEGLDLEVIRSSETLLASALAIQCELRFQPFYVGEPAFHEANAYLAEQGFELITLRPEFWKPRTAHRDQFRDGRIVWADCLFMRPPRAVRLMPRASLAEAKQILLALGLGRRSHAEYLLESYREDLPGPWLEELAGLAGGPPAGSRGRLRRLMQWLGHTSPFDLRHLADR